MGASEVVSVVCHASSVCISVVSGQRSCGLVSWVDGCVERIEGTDVCCTKLQKTKETGLVFSQLVDPTGSHLFFCFDGNLGGACHSTGCLVFSNHGVTLRSVPKGLHGHAQQLTNTSSSGVSRRVWKVTSQRCGWAYIIWWEVKAFSAV